MLPYVLMHLRYTLLGFVIPLSTFSQSIRVEGVVFDWETKTPLSGVVVSIEDDGIEINTDDSGYFVFDSTLEGIQLIKFEKENYVDLRMELFFEETTIKLGKIYMENKITRSEDHFVISNSELDSEDDFIPNTGNLSANRDLLVARAAFDLGQVFFRTRGYDSRYGRVLLNGIPMNRLSNGRPQWSNWGGLNDVIRNQDNKFGLGPAANNFGDVLGLTAINTRPGVHRPGLRITNSVANRTYRSRIMGTYNSFSEKNNLGFTISMSRRWGRSGYIKGTPYEAISSFGSLEYKINDTDGIYLTAFLAFNRRARNSAITAELREMAGKQYNPNWGIQEGGQRSAKIREIKEPVLMFNYYKRSRKIDIDFGMAYQWGSLSNSRLGYYNAPNPNPDYYQNLPSYFINSPIGANFISADMARKAFSQNPQINWPVLYQSNETGHTDGKASYILYDDVVKEQILRASAHLGVKTGSYSHLDVGANWSGTKADYFSVITDLMGATYHLDKDPFSNTLNDVDGNPQKKKNELFGYHYGITHDGLDAYFQWRFRKKRYSGYIGGKYYFYSLQRHGFFRNQRFPETSEGPGVSVRFSQYGVKAGLSFKLTGRHIVEVNSLFSHNPPVQENVFINPRENNDIVSGITDGKISSLDISYRFNLPKLSGRLTGYFTRFQDETDINFFFVNSGVGSDFVQEVITGLDRLHKGLELGMVYNPSSSVSVSAVASVSKFVYASNPDITINFDTSGDEDDLINKVGKEALGPAQLKGMNYSAGPAQAYSLGLEYRDPKYWRIGITFNRLSQNYIRISPIRRTESFKTNPETGRPFAGATDENLKRLLAQRPFDAVYLVNLTFGKSWLWDGKYISFFASVSNLLDTEFISGGFEQSRNGNYGRLQSDGISGHPSFGPKYWYGYGRTYFLNLSVSI